MIFALTLSGHARPPSKAELQRSYPSWYKNVQKFDFQAEALPQAHICEVDPSLMPEAQERLQIASAVELSLQEARRMAGRRVKRPRGTKPYLVRAVRLMDREPAFNVYAQRDGALRIISGGMGGGRPLVKNYPLIIFLRKAPAQVYPTWHLTV